MVDLFTFIPITREIHLKFTMSNPILDILARSNIGQGDLNKGNSKFVNLALGNN